MKVTQSLLEMGCYSVSLGDTIGVGTAGSTAALLDEMRAAGVPMESLAVHFHDTYGQALANILVALEQVCFLRRKSREGSCRGRTPVTAEADGGGSSLARDRLARTARSSHPVPHHIVPYLRGRLQ